MDACTSVVGEAEKKEKGGAEVEARRGKTLFQADVGGGGREAGWQLGVLVGTRPREGRHVGGGWQVGWVWWVVS